MAASHTVTEFVRRSLDRLSPEDRDSPDVTLHLFRMIEFEASDLYREYQLLFAQNHWVNNQIGYAVRHLENRENDYSVSVPQGTTTLILNSRYMRFRRR